VSPLAPKIRERTATNEMVAEWLGWSLINEDGWVDRDPLWRAPGVPKTHFSHLPNWLGSTDAALTLVPAGRAWEEILDEAIEIMSDNGWSGDLTRFPAAIILVILQIRENI